MEVEFSYVCCTECKQWSRIAEVLSCTVLGEQESDSDKKGMLFNQKNTQLYCAECSTLLGVSSELIIAEHSVNEFLDRDGNLQKVKVKKELGCSISELKLLNTLTQQLRKERVNMAITKK